MPNTELKINYMVTLRLKCQKKSQTDAGQKPDGTQVSQHQIDFFLGYDSRPENPNYPFTQLSGGTTMQLLTINEEAAAKFVIGKSYPVTFGEAI